MKKVFAVLVFYYLLFITNYSLPQWSVYNLPYNGLAYRMDFYNLNTGVSCGHTLFPFNENIFYTTNSGTNWLQAAYPVQLRALVSVQFINSSVVYACGAMNNIINYEEKNPVNIKNFYRNNYLLKGITKFYEPYRAVLVKSTNTGVSWSIAGQVDSLTGYIEGMQFFNESTGYAVIDTNPSGYPKFCRTINSGLNWQVLSRYDSNFVTNDMKFLDFNTGFICGSSFFGNEGHSLIYKTTNGGFNWTGTDFTDRANFTGINFFNNTTGIAIGNTVAGGSVLTKIFRTTNTGITWDSVFYYPNVASTFIKILSGTGISFASGYLAYDTMTAYRKTFTFKSTDYGLTWITKYFNTNYLISGGELIDQNNFFICGGDFLSPAVILKSTNGGNVFVNQTGNEIPASFALYQNYPNPFNPLTKIKYQIANNKLVVLKVYNILGKEVTTLVSEKLSPGTYEVSWDASQYPGGVYFYRLNAGEFSETKKMILIK